VNLITRAGAGAAVEGRTIVGVALPYNREAQVADWDFVGTEIFRPGAFRRSLAQRGPKTKLLLAHDTKALPLGTPELLEERPDGLHLRALIADTAAGRDVLALAREGHELGLSVGFSLPEGGARYTGADHREVLEARLHEISVCTFPQYVGAGVTAVRSQPAHPPFVHVARRRLWLTLQEIS
jgi:HK97 family phage prohead protease